MSSARRALPHARHHVFALCVAALAGACSDERDGRAEAAERARQMRDVARMLDAMESPPMLQATVSPTATPGSAAPPLSDAPASRGPLALTATAWAASTSLLAVLAGSSAWWWRRRRRHPAPTASPASFIASRVAAADHAPTPVFEDPTIARPTAPPAWAYQANAFETPTLQLTLEPVDLLCWGPNTAPSGAPERGQASPPGAGSTLLEQLHAPGTPARLYLSGDRDYPAIRHVGDDAADFAGWETILRERIGNPADDSDLARWLLPALLRLRAARMPPAEARTVLDEATALCIAGKEACAEAERPWWQAQWLRTRLARVGLGSGASRLLGLRDLGTDAHETESPALDAWVDVHLAWSGWLAGAASRARLDIADAVCRRLASRDAAWGAHRQGEVMLHRAGLAKGDLRLACLDDALVLLERSARTLAAPSTLLLMAEAARQRATLLSPADAAQACDVALRHAFMAGEHAAWRTASLEMRLAIQATHDGLSGHGVDGDIAATLRRELAEARSLLHPGTP